MNKRQARKHVASCAYHILARAGGGDWLWESVEDPTQPMSDADAARVKEAFEDLLAELFRRGSDATR